jgi:hypothetical protein
MTLPVHGNDGKDYEFPYTDSTTVSDIISEIRKLLPEEVSQIDLVRGLERLPLDASIASLGLSPTDKLKFFIKRRSRAALPQRTSSYGGRAPPIVQKRHPGGLPTRTDVDLSEVRDPANFNELVEQLNRLELPGITREDIVKALRTAFFDSNKASEFLLAKSGQAPPPIKSERETDLRLTQEDRVQLQVISGNFPAIDRATVIQVYFANGKNVEETQGILANWR